LPHYTQKTEQAFSHEKARCSISETDKLFVVVLGGVHHDYLAALVLAALGARPVRLSQLPTARALHQLRNCKILVSATIAPTMARHFTLRYGTHERTLLIELESYINDATKHLLAAKKTHLWIGLAQQLC
jgi:hypothetical protein